VLRTAGLNTISPNTAVSTARSSRTSSANREMLGWTHLSGLLQRCKFHTPNCGQSDVLEGRLGPSPRRGHLICLSGISAACARRRATFGLSCRIPAARKAERRHSRSPPVGPSGDRQACHLTWLTGRARRTADVLPVQAPEYLWRAEPLASCPALSRISLASRTASREHGPVA
jgi:hypothetical protein